jgi:hypothetical protein
VLEASDPSFQGINLPEGPAGEMAAALKEPTRRLIAELAVDPHSVVFDNLPDGQHQVRLEFAIVGFDAEGRRVNSLGRTVTMKLDPAQFDQIVAHGIRVRMALDLPLQEGSLRIAVQDLSAARIGSLEVPLAAAVN